MERTAILLLLSVVATGALADMMRKSIVFDVNSPKVFYCPQEKPRALDKMIVKARPVEKLCEFGGKGLPKGYRSDCYNDVDESEYACAEKQRILLRINPPNDTEATTTQAPTTKTVYKKGKSVKIYKL